jgi:hypothetical protein
VTEAPRQGAEELIRARGWSGVTVDAVLEMPSIFIGSVDRIGEDMEARRERYGFSYYVLLRPRRPAPRPVRPRRGAPGQHVNGDQASGRPGSRRAHGAHFAGEHLWRMLAYPFVWGHETLRPAAGNPAESLTPPQE